MAKLSDLEEKERRLKLIQWGESKAGKSYRAASAAKWGKVYFFDFDGNIQRLIEDFKGTELYANIEADTYSTYADGAEAEKAVLDKLQEITDSIKAGKPKYATVVVDSWTAWQHMVLDKILSRRQTKAAGLSVVTPQTEDYQKHTFTQKQFIQKFFNGLRPLNVIINCHVKESKDEQLGILKPGLNASGQLALELQRFANEIHFLENKNGKHQVRVAPDHRVVAHTSLQDKPKNGLMEDTSLAPFESLAYKDSE